MQKKIMLSVISLFIPAYTLYTVMYVYRKCDNS